MTLRLQLLLLSLLTLLLPWGGCRYAREVETVLREGEQQALLSAANTLAAVLATEPAATDPRLTATGFDPTAGDLYVHRLHTRPLLDGYADEWNVPETAFQLVTTGDALQVRYLAATDEQNLYLLFRITDPLVRLEQMADDSLPPEERADHFRLALPAADGAARNYLFITSAPGLIGAHRISATARGRRVETTEPRIQAWWQPQADGYRLEISVPQTMVEGRVGFEAVDVGDFTMGPVRVGTLDPQTHQPRSGRLLQPAVELEQKLATLLPPGTRALVANENGWILAQTGALTPAQPRPYERSADWLQAIYRRLLESGREALPVRPSPPGRIGGAHADAALAGRAGSAWFRLPDERRSVLAVAVPLAGATGASPAQSATSVLVLEQTGERLLVLRDRALTRLLNLTLLVTGAAVLAIFIFATVLGLRLGRLKRAAETALTHEGRIISTMPETRAADELGDLARSYQRLLGQLNEYTGYLRTLAGKLAHELRTPLTIVRSSIENLESERTANSPDLYLARAREGADRLQGIITAMSAATRTEEAMQHAERRTFDLNALVVTMARAYADAFPARRFEARTPGEPCRVDGAPDLMAQLLDKLVDNAVDFSAAGSLIIIELCSCPDGQVELCVINTGPPISPALRARMFESMFQLRGAAGEARSAGVHFGLGLYVVRLIAEYHRGEPFAQNLEEPGAVRIGIRLPQA